jgi:hypothetical protein
MFPRPLLSHTREILERVVNAIVINYGNELTVACDVNELSMPATHDLQQLPSRAAHGLVPLGGELFGLVIPPQSRRSTNALFIVIRHAVVVVEREFGILAGINANLLERLRGGGTRDIDTQRHD